MATDLLVSRNFHLIRVVFLLGMSEPGGQGGVGGHVELGCPSKLLPLSASLPLRHAGVQASFQSICGMGNEAPFYSQENTVSGGQHRVDTIVLCTSSGQMSRLLLETECTGSYLRQYYSVLITCSSVFRFTLFSV